MAPSFFSDYSKKNYDPGKDTWTFSTYQNPNQIKPLTVGAVDKIYDGFSRFGEIYMREAVRQMNAWKPKPIEVDEKTWRTLYMSDWGIGVDVAVPKKSSLPTAPVEDTQAKERARKIHNLYWARKQKDPEFNLLT